MKMPMLHLTPANPRRLSVITAIGIVLLLLIPTILHAQIEVFGCDEVSLRTAISNALPGDSIVFTQDCSITLTAPLAITNEVTIDSGGNTVTFQGATGVRVFDITNGANVTLIGLTITGGNAALGGGLYIRSANCVVQLQNCTLVGNNAIGADGINGPDGSTNGNNGGNGLNGFAAQAGRGGAIYNLGTLFLYNTLVVSNTTGGGNGGSGGNGGNSIGGNFLSGSGGNGGAAASGVGGGVYSSGVLVVSNCIFSANTAFGGEGGQGGVPGTNGFAGMPGSGGVGASGNGAAIYTIGASNVIVNSTFVDNSAESGASAAAGTGSTGTGVSGAAGASSLGGGIYLGATGYVANCTFFLNNCFGGNGANGGSSTGVHTAGNGGNGGDAIGGGLCAAASVQLVSCTFSNCNAIAGTNGVAGSGGGATDGTIGSALGGDIARIAGTFKLKYTILATNVSGGAFFGTINDNGYNIYFGTNNLSQATTFKTNNVRLGPLADNGGSDVGAPGTDTGLTTMRLTNSSAAFNRIPTNLVSSRASTIPLPEFDQRGVSRIEGRTKADIGAYAIGAPLLQLSNQVATVGQDLTVTVIASGDGPFTYQWFTNGIAIEDEITATLTIPDVAPDIGTNISVRVTNPYGAATATLVVHFAPSITTQPVSLTVQPGDLATLSVTNTGDLPLTNIWFFRSTNATTFSAIVTNRTATNLVPGNITNWSTVTIPGVTTTNLGSYFVAIANPYGNLTSAVATVTFGVAPIITRVPTSASNNIGSSVTFSVTAFSDPPPTYQWAFNTTNIPGAVSSTYTINNIQAADQGTYTVAVSNSVGVTSAPPAFLTVILPSAPHDLFGPISQSVTWDSNVIFTVQAQGTTPFTYAWYFNNSPIIGAGGSSLQLSHARLPNAGSYYVWVGNSLGSIQSDTAVLQVTPPKTKITPSPSSFSFSTVAGFTYIVDYNTNIVSPAWAPLSTNPGTGSTLTVPDSVLTPTRFYRVRVQ